MNSEESRLRSFSTWPVDVPTDSRTLSANGFFATETRFEIECNWCHCRFCVLEIIGNIEERHRRSSPYCEFIINKSQCGNLPLSAPNLLFVHPQEDTNTIINQESSLAAKEHPTLDLLIEKDRLATFVNWPNPNITPQSLAKAGFFYRNRSDEVECAWCKGVIAQWEKQDNAFEEHQRFFPECPRVQLGPLIEIANDGIRDLGIQQISAAKNPKYSSLHSRISSYSNWPIPDIQKPEDLAQAGLYYQKVDDQVRCFHCNMGLRSWEKEDDPWFEHAKWYPMCEFVRLVKGVNYIQEVQKLTRTSSSTSNSLLVPITIDEAMKTESVKLALEMGVDINTLKNITHQQILKTGHPFRTIEDLLKAVFDEKEDYFLTPQTSNSSRSRRLCRTNANENRNIENITSFDEINIGHAYSTTCASTESSSSVQNDDNKLTHENDVLNKKLITNQIDNTLPGNTGNLTLNHKFLEEENRKLKDARLCKVCLDEEVGVVYLPCGHLVTCVQCAPGVNQCPMCRTAIKGFVRTYLS